MLEPMDVEEFYNACHSKSDGRFCGKSKSGYYPKGATIVLQSGLKGTAVGRYSEGSRTKKSTGSATEGATPARPGGIGGAKFYREAVAKAKAPAAKKADPGLEQRRLDAKRGPYPAKKVNKDDGLPTPKFKLTGNKREDAINITTLDRGSPERKAAAQAFQKRYG